MMNTGDFKLWVDDERPSPDESWLIAKTVDEAKMFLGTAHDAGFGILAVSLDYTLGYRYGDGTGQDVLEWMIAEGIKPERLTVHSSNHSGRELLIRVAERAGWVAEVFS